MIHHHHHHHHHACQSGHQGERLKAVLQSKAKTGLALEKQKRIKKTIA
jgi:hypothetical protein